jgi:hypothetical protein
MEFAQENGAILKFDTCQARPAIRGFHGACRASIRIGMIAGTGEESPRFREHRPLVVPLLEAIRGESIEPARWIHAAEPTHVVRHRKAKTKNGPAVSNPRIRV